MICFLEKKVGMELNKLLSIVQAKNNKKRMFSLPKQIQNQKSPKVQETIDDTIPKASGSSKSLVNYDTSSDSDS